MELIDYTNPQCFGEIIKLNYNSQIATMEDLVEKAVEIGCVPYQWSDLCIKSCYEPISELNFIKGELNNITKDSSNGKDNLKNRPIYQLRTKLTRFKLTTNYGELVYFHRLYLPTSSNIRYNYHRLRLFKPSENVGWRDVEYHEYPVYLKYSSRTKIVKTHHSIGLVYKILLKQYWLILKWDLAKSLFQKKRVQININDLKIGDLVQILIRFRFISDSDNLSVEQVKNILSDNPGISSLVKYETELNFYCYWYSLGKDKAIDTIKEYCYSDQSFHLI